MKKILIIFCLILLSGCSLNECPDGYKYNNGVCEKKINEKAKEKLSCDIGYELIGEQCIKKTKELADVIEYCPSGYTKEDGYCIMVDKYDPKLNKWCDKGILENGSCYEYYYTDAYVRKVCPASHPNRDYGSFGECYQYYNIYKAQTKYGKYDDSWAVPMCNSGDYWYPERTGYCAKKKYTSLVDEFYCYSGELVGNKCLTKKIVSYAKTEYETCAAGYSGTAVCSKIDVIDYKREYKCKLGYSLDGITCVKTDTADAFLKEYCEGGIEPVNGMCNGIIKISLNK